MFKKILIFSIVVLSIFLVLKFVYSKPSVKGSQSENFTKKSYWFILHRKTGEEFLYYGIMGDKDNSRLIKTFQVKTGVFGKKPTPLPSLLGRKYWLITKKELSQNPETAPYFLTLDVPVSEEPPYGPVPYKECDGQCDWELPGAFGLHGVSGDVSKLSAEDLGSSGCVRHRDEDITYLYNLLNPEKEEIRYYVEDI